MYRDGIIYDEIDKVIIDIFLDYGIKQFLVDEKEICRKMGVVLKPYSAYKWKDRILLKKKSQQGFFVKESKEFPPTIHYNDIFHSEGSIRFTIFHELKHYVFEDEDDEDDDLADYFARHFMCPTAYLMFKEIDSPDSIVALCGTSMEAAGYAYSGVVNRRNKYGLGLFEHEVVLLEHLEPTLLKKTSYEVISKEGCL